MPFDTENDVAYVTATEARTFGIGAGMADAELDVWLDVASRVVDTYTGCMFGVGTTERTWTQYRQTSQLLILPGPFSDVTEVTSDGEVIASSVYDVQDIGIDLGYGSHAGRTVTVTGVFGYPTVPAVVKQATLFIARNLVAASSQRPTFGTDTEGNATSLPTASFIPSSRLGDGSTGSVNADRLLAAYRIPVFA